MKTRVTTALIVMVVAGWLSGCRGEPQSAPAATPAARPPGLRIAMIAKSATNPIFVSARKGAETAAKELAQKHGIPIEIVWMTPSDEDGQVQAQKIAQAVNEGVPEHVGPEVQVPHEFVQRGGARCVANL